MKGYGLISYFPKKWQARQKDLLGNHILPNAPPKNQKNRLHIGMYRLPQEEKSNEKWKN
jgi:hypothetical protein